MRTRLYITLLASVCAVSAAAQTVTLDSCRNMALRNNKAIMMADRNIEGAGYQRKAAAAAYLPGIRSPCWARMPNSQQCRSIRQP